MLNDLKKLTRIRSDLYTGEITGNMAVCCTEKSEKYSGRRWMQTIIVAMKATCTVHTGVIISDQARIEIDFAYKLYGMLCLKVNYYYYQHFCTIITFLYLYFYKPCFIPLVE